MVLADIDGTLIHRCAQGDSGAHLDIGGLQHVDRESYVAVGTVDRLQEIKQCVPLIFITSRRRHTYAHVASLIAPTLGIVEDGCVVLDEHGNNDPGWLSMLQSDLAALRACHGTLQALQLPGIEVVTDGFEASFKIELPEEDAPQVQANRTAYLHSKGIELPEFLRCSYNSQFNSLVVIPRQAGKANAARYVMNKFGIEPTCVAALGDDLNDEEMLREAGWASTLASAYPTIKQLVANKPEEYGFLAQLGGHEGTQEMLDHLLATIRAIR